jgi:hypothetical protein
MAERSYVNETKKEKGVASTLKVPKQFRRIERARKNSIAPKDNQGRSLSRYYYEHKKKVKRNRAKNKVARKQRKINRK